MDMTIYSPEKTLFTGEVEMVEFPGGRGRFQVLKDHDSIISTLVDGVIRFRTQGEEKLQPVKSGYVEVHHNVITVCLHV